MNNLTRRSILLGGSSSIGFGLSACGGGEQVDKDQAPQILGERRSTYSTAPQKSTESAINYFDTIVRPDPKRNYIFGPQPAYLMTGFANVGVGEIVLANCTGGQFNTAMGDQVMNQLTVGINNVGIGASSMFSAVDTIDCTAVGTEALRNARDGVGATALGRLACATMTSAGNNTGLGDSALRFLESGIGNTAVGYTSAENVMSGSFNVIIGAAAGKNISQARYNTIIGVNALTATVADCEENVVIGAEAMNRSAGSHNVAIGMRAGSAVTTALNSIFIGGVSLGAIPQREIIRNSVSIGYNTAPDKDNQIIIGNDESGEVILCGVKFSKEDLAILLKIAKRFNPA